MINLLPPQQKEELLREKKFKLTLILGITCLAVLISFALVLFVIKTAVSADLAIQKIYSKQQEAVLKIPKIKTAEEKIKNSNYAVLGLASFYQTQIGLSEILEKVSLTLPAEAYLDSLNFNPASGQVSLSGFAPTREILLNFKKNLEEEKLFSGVYFPPANWAHPVDINFAVNFKTSQ